MARKRYTEEQIIAVLNEAEAGAKTSGLCRQHGVNEAQFRIDRLEYTRSLNGRRQGLRDEAVEVFLNGTRDAYLKSTMPRSILPIRKHSLDSLVSFVTAPIWKRIDIKWGLGTLRAPICPLRGNYRWVSGT